jgi:glycosyltransferase involved in cell wall biosynthesis
VIEYYAFPKQSYFVSTIIDPNQKPMKLSVVIPTYGREEILLNTIQALLKLTQPEHELLIIDQTLDHTEAVKSTLNTYNAEKRIRWICLPQPSIPVAMNRGLREAQGEIVLFLDDDITPDPNLLTAHIETQSKSNLVAGQVLQPGEISSPLKIGENFRFNSTEARQISEFMGGNFSIKRSVAIALGGFDENFMGAAYRYEAEFAHRYCQKYGSIAYEPKALIHHLRAESGGTRSYGHHLRTAQPAHTFGAYYFLLKSKPQGWLSQLLWRPIRSIRTKYHLTHPWWIVPALVAEARGFGAALVKSKQGPSYPNF